MEDLIKKNKIKFDWHIDYLQLGAQFMQVKTVKDYPRMLEKLDSKEWQNFFIDQVKNFSGKIIN